MYRAGPEDIADCLLIDAEKRIVYLGGEITGETVSSLLAVSAKFALHHKPALIVINSEGGSLTDSLACVDIISGARTQFHCLAIGACMSGATLIVSACQKRYSFPNTIFMFHELHIDTSDGGSSKTFHQITSEIPSLVDLNGKMLKLYSRATGASRKQIRHDLHYTRWLSAQQALRYGKKGLIDQVITRIPRPFDI